MPLINRIPRVNNRNMLISRPIRRPRQKYSGILSKFCSLRNSTVTAMLKNYFKIALRSIARDKAHSFINIAGLSIGMAVALLIGLWIFDEISYNKNFDHY